MYNCTQYIFLGYNLIHWWGFKFALQRRSARLRRDEKCNFEENTGVRVFETRLELKPISIKAHVFPIFLLPISIRWNAYKMIRNHQKSAVSFTVFDKSVSEFHKPNICFRFEENALLRFHVVRLDCHYSRQCAIPGVLPRRVVSVSGPSGPHCPVPWSGKPDLLQPDF